jgi:hypothetical protein
MSTGTDMNEPVKLLSCAPRPETKGPRMKTSARLTLIGCIKPRSARRAVKRLEGLGYAVSLVAAPGLRTRRPLHVHQVDVPHLISMG